MDELVLRVEASAEIMREGDGGARRSAFRAEVAQRMHKLLGLRTVVEVVEHGTLPRTDFKARRVIDDRAVFREMNNQLRGPGGMGGEVGSGLGDGAGGSA